MMHVLFEITLPEFLFHLTALLVFSLSLLLYSYVGLTNDGSNENIDSLEEVVNILAEESSDWFCSFLSFLYDIMTPFEMLEEAQEEGEEEEEEEEEEEGKGVKKKSKTTDGVDGMSQKEGVQGTTCIVLTLFNQ